MSTNLSARLICKYINFVYSNDFNEILWKVEENIASINFAQYITFLVRMNNFNRRW